MTQRNYGKVSVPRPLLDRVNDFISKNPRSGYTSASDFIKHAIIEKLERYKS